MDKYGSCLKTSAKLRENDWKQIKCAKSFFNFKKLVLQSTPDILEV